MGLREFFSGRTTPTHRAGGAITAAAQVIDPADEKERARIGRGATEWQRQAWQFYDDLEAISYPADYVAGAMGRLRLGPAMRPDAREQPIMLDPEGKDDLDITPEERAACEATMERLTQGPIEIAQLQQLIALNLFIAGDGYLLGYQDPELQEELWDVVSVDELVKDPAGGGYARKRTLESGYMNVESLPDDTFICRIYQRHPRFSLWARSSMKPVIGLCEELKVLTDSIMASGQSRIPAGIAFLTHGLLGLPVDETAIGQDDEAELTPTAKAIIRHFEAPVKNRRSASSVVPLMLVGEPEDIDKSHVWEPTRHIDEVAANQRQEVIQRIAIGLDIPAEILTGKADLNHWTAWQVSEDTFKFHLEPDAQVMVNALTTGYFRMHLAKMGVQDVNRFFVWYDPTDLISHPNRAQDYSTAYDNIEVSGEAYRRAHNIPDDDAPEDDERALRIWQRLIEKIRLPQGAAPPSPADVLAWIEREHTDEPGPGEPIDPQANTGPGAPGTGPSGSPSPAKPGPPPAGPETTTKGPPATKPPSQQSVPTMAQLAQAGTIGPIGPRLAHIDDRLRLRLMQAADDTMQRVLERAGNRLRSLANRDASMRSMLANTPAIEIASVLGRDGVARLQTSAEDLLDGQFDKLQPQWNAWTQRAQEQALDIVDAHGELDEPSAAMLRDQQGRDREEGWGILASGLGVLAANLLYEPHREPPDQGEWSNYTVDPGLIRDALIEAGGGADSDFTSGMMSGSTIHGAFDQAGLEVRSYLWNHGDPDRPFPAHEDLDGLIFYDDEDPVLAVGDEEGWLDGDYYHPGDHKGCLCSIMETVEVRPLEPDVEL